MTIYAVLRLVHILSGVFWAGVNFTMAGFITPSVKATSPGSSGFMQHLAQKSGLPRYAEIAGWLTIIAGLALYWVLSDGFQLSWFVTRRGIVLAFGGLLAIAAMILAYAVQKPAAKRIGALGQEIQAGGGPPSPEQIAEMQALQNRMAQGARWTAILLVIAVAAMALSRY
jgi:hypothetical protein